MNSEKVFDVEDCFEKYYFLDTILRCIRLCKEKRIFAKYLAYWCNAYNWIMMGGFRGKVNDENEKNISLQTMVIWDKATCSTASLFTTGHQSTMI